MNGEAANPKASPVEIIFNAALGLPPAERPAYLAGACGNDLSLCRRVKALLRAHEGAQGFLPERPGTSLGARFSSAATRAPGAGEGAARAEKPGARIGPYRLREKIGEGGCGIVYVAEQEAPIRRRVALKVIKLGMDTKQVIARFEAERQALALMDHPNIAKVLDAGASEAGRPYFVMELVRGVRITDYCDQHRLPTRERLDLFVQVCRAIQHAHQKGIIHRDIKPSNILVTVNDGVPVPKVIDFGIAKATAGPLTDKTVYTAFEQFLGTPAYMSPEQAAMTSLDIDTRSDIYSLGVLLYELLTGRTPFDTKELLAAGLDEMRRTICENEPVRPSKVVESLSEMAVERCGPATHGTQLKSLSRDLDWIVMKCLEKDRARRYGTANGLARDIQRFLAHEPVAACPPSGAYRVQKFVRRNKAIVGSAALVAAVLVLGVCTSLWEAMRATRAASEQRRLRAAAQLAERTATERLIRLNVANAVRLTDEGNLLGALPWIAESIRLSEGNAAEEDAGRYRFETAWDQSPRLSVVALHRSRIYAGAFSPDGRRFITASANHTATVWDAHSGQAVFPPLAHSGEVRQALFSPNGQRIATIGCDATLWIWDAATGQAVCSPVQHQLDIRKVAFSPDGQRIATCSGAAGWNQRAVLLRYSASGRMVEVSATNAPTSIFLGEVQVWDSSDGRAVGAPLRHADAVRDAAFSPDGQRLVTACDDGAARIWDLRTGKVTVPPLKHDGQVRCATFSPDGRLVVTASEDHTARLWDARTGAAAGPPMRHAKGVLCAAFSPDGRRVVTASRDQSARLWETGTGQEVGAPLQHESEVRHTEFSPDGRWVVTSGSEPVIRVWDAEAGGLRAVLAHNSSGTFATFSPDGRRLLSVGRDHVARVWDLRPLSLTGLRLPHPAAVVRAEFSGDGRRVLTDSASETARLWDARTGQVLGRFGGYRGLPNYAFFAARFSPSAQQFVTAGRAGARLFFAMTNPPGSLLLTASARVNCALFSPNGRFLATGSSDGTAQVWETATGRPVGPSLKHDRRVLVCAFTPDGSALATGSSDVGTATEQSEVNVWDAQTGRRLSPRLVLRGMVSDLRFDPSGRTLLSAAVYPPLEEREAQIWDWRTGRPTIPPLRHKDGVPRAEFSPDGRRVVTASFDTTAQIWDAKTGRPLTPPLRHARQVEDACFSPRGLRVATASSDQTARVWDALTGEPLTPPLKHDGPVWCVRFSPDGRRLVTASGDHTARIWQLAKTPRPISDLALMAALSSGQRIDRTGKLAPLEPAELDSIWRTLRAQYPADFSGEP